MSFCPRIMRNCIPHGSRGNSIRALQDAFRDPQSPYHIRAGEQGPSSPEELIINHEPTVAAVEHTNAFAGKGNSKATTALLSDAASEAHKYFIRRNYDPSSFWEQQVVWGDQDSFQHVNNVRYVRFIESARIKWMQSLGREIGGLPGGIGGKAQEEAMLKAKGVSLILKSIEVKFRRPVTFPDTLLIAHVPLLPSESASEAQKNTEFAVRATAYSYTQQAIVADSTSVLVWYNYDTLKKCDPGEGVRNVVARRSK